jgi:hypothetical protein
MFRALPFYIFNFIKQDRFLIKLICLIYIIIKIFSREKPLGDELKQLASANNFLHGFGFVERYFDGSYIFLKEVYQWPLFYRLFAIPFLSFSNDHIFVAYILKFASVLFLVLSLRYLFTFLLEKNQRNFALNICFFFIAFNIAPFNYGGSIDILSVSSFLFIVCFSYKYFYLGYKKIDLFFLFALIFLLLNMRYAYIPKIFGVVCFVFLFDFYKKSLNINLFWKIGFYLLISINFYILLTSDYFQSTSDKIVFNEGVTSIESYWNMLYAVFAIPFVPDFILLNMISQIFKVSFSNNYFFFVGVFMLLSFITFYLMAKKTLLRFKEFNLRDNYIILMLLLGVSLNLILMTLIYGFDNFYSLEKIKNTNSLIYNGITIYNRYFMLSSTCIFLICLYFMLALKAKFFKLLFLFAGIFGALHSAYLTSKYSFIRERNTSFFSLPVGSYQDSEKIYRILNQKKNILFVDNMNPNKTINRQTNPNSFAKNSGAVIYKSTIKENKNLKKLEYSFLDFDEIIYCDFKSEESKYLNKYLCLYSGNIYSLFRKKDDQK